MNLKFGSSGIRGKYPEEVNPFVAFELGRRLAIGGRRLALGCDPRLSSPALKSSLISSTLEGGGNIIDYNVIPTPVLAFETRHRGASWGVMVTASHNPPEYNGFKVFNSTGEAIDDDNELRVKGNNARHSSSREEWGLVEQGDPSGYRSSLSEIRFRKKWKVVLDPGNGATYRLAYAIYRERLDRVTCINSVPDGNFPARGSEPTPDSMNMLSKVVVETKADAGIGFDGDGDRMFIVDEKGRRPLQDRVLASYIGFLAQKSKGPFLIPIDASMAVDEVASRYGAQIVRGPVGDARLLREMKREGAKFAGEPSGAWIHEEYNSCPDGILSGLLFLKSLEDSGKTVSQSLEGIPQYFMMRKSLRLKASLPRDANAVMARKLRPIIGKDSSLTVKYGIRVSSNNSWILVRESGTEPVLRVTGESKLPAELQRIMKQAFAIISQHLKKPSRN